MRSVCYDMIILGKGSFICMYALLYSIQNVEISWDECSIVLFFNPRMIDIEKLEHSISSRAVRD